MKAHAQRTARLQLIASMLEGQSWQQAMVNADLSIGRSTAYRLVQQARDPEQSERPFLDDRHGHPYKLTEPMRRWIVEYCTQHPGVYSSQVKAELQAQFGLEVSRGHINRVRAEAGVTAPWRGRAKKSAEWQRRLDSRCSLKAAGGGKAQQEKTMARRTSHQEATHEKTLTPLQERCEQCGQPLWVAYHPQRTVTTLVFPVEIDPGGASLCPAELSTFSSALPS